MDKNPLLQGILKEAEQESKDILKEANDLVEQRNRAIDSQIKAIFNEEEEKVKRQKEIIERNILSNINIEKKRINLKVKESAVNESIEQVKKNLEKKINTPEYEGIFLSWVIEAAIGLDVEEASIHTSHKEQAIVTDAFIKKAEKEIKQITGRDVKLHASKEKPLLAQGIVLRAKSNKTAFNNQVPTRLLRYQSEIRRIIYEELF